MYIRKIAANPIPLGERIALAAITEPDSVADDEDDGAVCFFDCRTGEEISVRGGSRWAASDLCTVTVGDEVLLAGGCRDGAVRLWSPRTGKQVRVLYGDRKPVDAVCQVETGGSPLLASANRDGIISLWNPANGRRIRTFQGSGYSPAAVCTVGIGPSSILAIDDERKILLWDPVNGNHIGTLKGHSGSIRALCEVKVDGISLLASGESKVDLVNIRKGEVDAEAPDCTVRLWDPDSGSQIGLFEGHLDGVTSICSFSTQNRSLLASASTDGTVRIWNPATQDSMMAIPVDYAATAIIAVDELLFIGLDVGVLAIELATIQPDSC